MKVGEITGQIFKTPKLNEIAPKDDKKFGNVFTDMIKNVNADQMNAMKMEQDFVEGKDVELHQVMIAGEKAKTSLELLTEIRNKAIDMYKELTRMQ